MICFGLVIYAYEKIDNNLAESGIRDNVSKKSYLSFC